MTEPNDEKSTETVSGAETTVTSGDVPVNPQDGQGTIAHVASGEDGGNPYNPQSGYLPDPGPQGLPHLPPAGQENAAPPPDSRGPGAELYSGSEDEQSTDGDATSSDSQTQSE
jgi:hypothetical protein